jgi:CRISPR system Cascade subunit CasA
MLGYKHWLGYVQNLDGDSEPARVINCNGHRQKDDFRLWAFGYDMDNMKACCWYEGVIPVIFIEDEQKWKIYGAHVAMLVRAANTISDFLSKAVVKALNAGVFNVVRQRFWQETEAEFYIQIKALRQEVIEELDGLSVRQAWHAYLAHKAEEIFNDMSQSDMIDIINAKRVSTAWNELRKSLYGKKLKIEILALPG